MKRILIAEDNLANQILMKKFLESVGICDLAEDGEAAVALFESALSQERPYDLVCLDLMMPKMDGIEALKGMRDLELNGRVPEAARSKIVIVTALSEAHLGQQAFEAGCDAYATKPIDRDRFFNTLRKLQIVD